ncbi:unnamed protein product [Polarella glacialis]|uniref:Polymerase nucleotidyl transferase domain-containing protein n=1 Tax=Polarella glacialis TaxID=89957 RepID=A0A813LBB9_POLGL|nr:unnamed protein product [Polarella glacialis]
MGHGGAMLTPHRSARLLLSAAFVLQSLLVVLDDPAFQVSARPCLARHLLVSRPPTRWIVSSSSFFRTAPRRCGHGAVSSRRTQRFAARFSGGSAVQVDLVRLILSLQSRQKFASYAGSLVPADADFPVAEAKDLVETHAKVFWQNAEAVLTGSCLRGTHTHESDIDFLLRTGNGQHMEGVLWHHFIESLKLDCDHVAQVEVGDKAVGFVLVDADRPSSFRCHIEVVPADRDMDTDFVPMPLLQGEGTERAANRSDVHQRLQLCYSEYPGIRNVVRVLKRFLPFKSFIVEALVKRAAKSVPNWDARDRDDTGILLFKYMLSMFSTYAVRNHNPSDSPVSVLMSSAKAVGKSCLREAKLNCHTAREVAAEVLGCLELLDSKPGAAGSEASELQVKQLLDQTLQATDSGSAAGNNSTTITNKNKNNDNNNVKPLPPGSPCGTAVSKEALVEVLRRAPKPMSVRDVYFAALGLDPTQHRMEASMKRSINQQLYALQRQGLLNVSGGFWNAAT